MGPTPRLNIIDPKLVKEILSNTELFQKPATIKLLLTGILAYDGEKWAKHRKLVNPAFQIEKLKLLVPAMYSSCCEMISNWEALVSTKGSRELDVWPYLSNLTANVISRTTFGSNYEEGKLIFQLLREQSDFAIQRLQSSFIPGWRKTKLGGLVLPGGVEIFVPIMEIHHDPDFWGEDSKDFKPQRFSEGISKASKVQGTFLPFGGGSRICIGQNFALVEAKTDLATILKRFSFQLSPSYVHAPSVAWVTVQPQHGAHLILQKLF
ncbi:hypothetical protein RHMOL_Rhmol06G0259400 [Rhododendron molle]|uniref:Uncharacterized protein n=1 Tax=Rhododendron molle TaxID=49168 RepID=A0ACC0NGL5_RHOML|nr:hypothetical protein RHMOL_Rhmol06G0259400 [Rhododendron molle]